MPVLRKKDRSQNAGHHSVATGVGINCRSTAEKRREIGLDLLTGRTPIHICCEECDAGSFNSEKMVPKATDCADQIAEERCCQT